MKYLVTFVPIAILLALLSGPAEYRSYMPLVSISAAAADYPPLVWPEKAAALRGITLERAACDAPCWRLVSLKILDESESGGLHHFFVKAERYECRLDCGWFQIADVPILVAWPTGQTTGETKAAPDWGDVPLWDCYFPDEGPGPYSGSLLPEGDVIHGMGLPACRHELYQATYRWWPGD